MSTFPSGVPEVDTQTLSQLDDASLVSVCSSNTYLDQLCSTEYFWRRRLIDKGYRNFLYLKDQGLFSTYRDLYIKLVNGAYVVVDGHYHYLYSNINDAYHQLIVNLASYLGADVSFMPPIERANEIGNLAQHITRPLFLELYIIPDETEIRMGDSRFLLLGVNNELTYNVGQQIGNIKFTINQNLTQMPRLNGLNTYICYELDAVVDPSINTIISINKIGPTEKDNQTFTRLINYLVNQRLQPNACEIIIIDDNNHQRNLKYMMNNLFVSSDMPAIIIDKVQNNFYMAKVPFWVYLRSGYLEKYNYISREQGYILDTTTYLLNNLPEIYSTLKWEPISNIINYPSDLNYSQKIGREDSQARSEGREPMLPISSKYKNKIIPIPSPRNVIYVKPYGWW